MPPIKKPAPTPTQPVPSPTPKGDDGASTSTVFATPGRAVIYPHYEVRLYCLPTGGREYLGPITVEVAKKLLKWETESEYTERMLAANNKLKESAAKFGDDFTLKLSDGTKVRCWNNARNRPFDEKHARELAQDTLNRSWEMNGENIIIGCTGLVLSGQHRLIGVVLAALEWQADKEFWNKWSEEPYIESAVFFGSSEDPKVVRTRDNVKTRTLSDNIVTSPIFEKLDADQKRVCSKMLATAVDLLWKRVKAGEGANKYQTTSSALDFYDRHPRLKACVKHVFDRNQNNVVSALKLSPGECSALMYLMGCSATDEADYYYPGSPRKESLLDWGNYDKAVQFWVDLTDPEATHMDVVRDALARLEDPNTGASVPMKVKNMVLCKAWNAYVNDEPIMAVDLDMGPHLKWSEDKQRTLIVEEPTVGGIDAGVVKGGGEKEDEIPTAEEQEREKERIKAENEQKRRDRAAQMNQTVQKGREHLEGKGNKPLSDEEMAAELEKVKAMQKKAESKPAEAPKTEPKKPVPPKRPTIAKK